MFGYLTENVGIPCNKRTFRQHVRTESVSVYQLKSMPCQKLRFLKRIVRIRHCARSDNARPDLSAQFITNDLKRIFLCTHRVKAVYAVAFASAVAVYAAVTAASVNIHVVVIAEPAAFCLCYDSLCRNSFNHRPHPFPQYCIISNVTAVCH